MTEILFSFHCCRSVHTSQSDPCRIYTIFMLHFTLSSFLSLPSFSPSPFLSHFFSSPSKTLSIPSLPLTFPTFPPFLHSFPLSPCLFTLCLIPSILFSFLFCFILRCLLSLFFTARCTIVQNAVLRLHVISLSVCGVFGL